MTIKAETEKKKENNELEQHEERHKTQEPASCTTPAATATTLQAQQQPQRKTIMSRNEQWIATQLAKFPKGVFPGGKKTKNRKTIRAIFLSTN